MVRRLLLAVLMAAVPVLAIVSGSAADAATATAASPCPGDIFIAQFAFNPPSVQAGAPSTLGLVAANCTNKTLSGQTTWSGQWTWAGAGLPPGCPVIDPARIPYTFAPQGVYSIVREQSTFAGCQATGLRVTVVFTVNNVGVVAQATADLTIVQ